MNMIWSKVKKTNSCWIWLGAKAKGYGKIKRKGKTLLVHRVIYEVVKNKKLSSEVHLLHSCDNPACVNPDHLRPGTRSDNMQDMIQRGRGNFKKGFSGNAKLSVEQVREIKNRLKEGVLLQREIAKIYGVGRKAISKIATNRTWAHV